MPEIFSLPQIARHREDGYAAPMPCMTEAAVKR